MDRLSQKFIDGNEVMGSLIASLTPPAPTGRCSDLASSLALTGVLSRFPDWVAHVPGGKTINAPSPLGTPWNGFGKARAPAGAKLFFRPLNRAGFVNYPRGAVQNEALRLIPDCPCHTPKPCDCGPVRSSAASPTSAIAPGPAITGAVKKITQARCRTDNICRDIRAGCVLSDQVSKEQLFACAKAGWSGNFGFFPQVTTQPNLPYLGTVDLNPYSPGESDTFYKERDRAQGLSGLFESGFDISKWGIGEWVIAGAGAFLAVSALGGVKTFQRRQTFKRYKKRLGA